MGDDPLMARSRTLPAATPVRQPNRRLIEQILGDPSLYPDEMKAWMPRFLSQNVNMQLTEQQIPQPGAPQVVGGAGTPAFLNGWTNYGGAYAPASYYFDPFGRVWLDGIVASGTVGATIFTLPLGSRPRYSRIHVVPSGNAVGSVTVGICTVNPDGTVVAAAGSTTYFSLCGISFRENG